MSVRLPQPEILSEGVGVAPYSRPIAPAAWSPQPQTQIDPEGIPWARYVDALKRHLLMILAIAFLGSGLGFFFAQRVSGVYEAQTTLWITSPSTRTQSGPLLQGPIQPQQLLQQTSWVELLRSYTIIDPVVRNLRLNVGYQKPADSVLFRNFESGPLLQPGEYVLRIEPSRRYVLSTPKGIAIERGALGDSVGRKVGFLWVPDGDLLAQQGELRFTVTTPRAASTTVVSGLRAVLPDDGQFLKITLSGTNPRRIATVLNALTAQFIASSGELKKRHLSELKKILGDQLGVAERELHASEIQLEQFRVNTITLPSDGTPVAGGVQATRDPVITNYFAQKQSLSDVRSDRAALEELLNRTNGSTLDPEAFLMMPSLLASAPQLRAAIDDYSSRMATLRSEQQFLTDANPRIKQLREGIRALQVTTIPQIARGILENLRAREVSMNSRVDTESRELRSIPSRTIEEMRLLRQVTVSANLYGVLKNRYEEASLAEAETTPDLSVLDVALPPSRPSSNEAPRLFLLSIVASIGAAIALALLRDRLDHKFRYPEQLTHELGLTIAGTVPRFKPGRGGDAQIDAMSQAVESFRTIRLALQYEFPPTAPMMLSVSSASSSDGKSLVSMNLALAFAGAGYRTLLIDGDVRRGNLHATFEVPVTPGLVEYLSRDADLEIVFKRTMAENLFLLPRGKRTSRASELLISEEMRRLIQTANQQFDVVIIDSPPFVAGVDAYALGAAAGNMLVVLRQGVSDRKLTAAKLGIVDRLPIRVLGAVINGVPTGGMYKYYGTGYGDGQAATKESVGNVATPGGLVVQA
jgi:succinoglycan biosynthesis transport protein ExoP